MAEKPVFSGIFQVGVVVKNLDDAMKKYWNIYGIGPWTIYTFNPSKVKNMTVRGKPVDYAMRVGFCFVGSLQWELIEPLDDKSIYSEFLKTKGEGLHHLAFVVENYNEVVGYLKEKGIGILQGGTTPDGSTYTYLDTQDTLYCIAEIFDLPQEVSYPTPEGTYP
jgi:4-hydroxyphenylpyruvate dioxygenase-like putative hemolysin